jgi:hypothetical protein
MCVEGVGGGERECGCLCLLGREVVCGMLRRVQARNVEERRLVCDSDSKELARLRGWGVATRGWGSTGCVGAFSGGVRDAEGCWAISDSGRFSHVCIVVCRLDPLLG